MEPFDNLNEVPIVGKFYWVRCARIIRKHNSKEIFIPIIGEKHKDKSFGPDKEHYHVDGRFKSDYVDEYGKTNLAVFIANDYGDIFKEIVYKLRKCVRSSTGINPPYYASKYYAWYNKQIGKSCAGKKCPHFGATMLEENGLLVCPMHNLKGDPKTEKIIPF